MGDLQQHRGGVNRDKNRGGNARYLHKDGERRKIHQTRKLSPHVTRGQEADGGSGLRLGWEQDSTTTSTVQVGQSGRSKWAGTGLQRWPTHTGNAQQKGFDIGHR
jgi:hypothetical protein